MRPAAMSAPPGPLWCASSCSREWLRFGVVRDPLVPAAVLVAAEVDLVVVGSAALMVYGELAEARDLDIVPSCHESNLARLHAQLTWISPRPVGPFAGRDIATVITSFGPVDVMLARGTQEFETLRARASTVDVYGVAVPVAARGDAWRLRRRFKAAS